MKRRFGTRSFPRQAGHRWSASANSDSAKTLPYPAEARSTDLRHDRGRAIQQPSWSAEEPAGEKRRDSGCPRLGVADYRLPPVLGKEDAIDNRLCGARPSWEAGARPPLSPL